MDRAKIAADRRPQPTMVFHEEAHAIEAVLSGQGIGICSSVLVGAEHLSGALSILSGISLPGLGFHVICREDQVKATAIWAFVEWVVAQAHQGL